MINAQQISEQLTNAGICYRIINHPAVFTSTEADRYVEGEKFIRTKNLFLTTRKHQHYYLLLLEEHQRLDTRKFRQQTGAPRVSFATATELREKLGLTPGSVSPFGLLNNQQDDVQLCVDRTVATAATIGCHPNDNTKTLILATSDLLSFLKRAGHPYHLVNL